jgi:hypothetical protein
MCPSIGLSPSATGIPVRCARRRKHYRRPKKRGRQLEGASSHFPESIPVLIAAESEKVYAVRPPQLAASFILGLLSECAQSIPLVRAPQVSPLGSPKTSMPQSFCVTNQAEFLTQQPPPAAVGCSASTRPNGRGVSRRHERGAGCSGRRGRF